MKYILITLLFLFSFSAYSQTLQDVIFFAIKDSPSLQAEKKKLEIYKEKINQAFGGFLPCIFFSGQYGWNKDRFQNFNSKKWLHKKEKSYGLEINENLLSGGNTISAYRAAQFAYDAARYKYQSDKQALIVRIVADYMHVLQNQSILQLNINNESLSKEHLKSTQNKYHVGQGTKTDVVSALANASMAHAEVVQASGELQNSYAQFLSDIGIPPKNLQQPHFLFPQLQSLDISLKRAMKNNLDILAASKNLDSARSALGVSQAGLLPKLDLELQAGRVIGRNTPNVWVDNKSAMLRLTIPIFQSGIQWSMVRADEFAVARAQQELSMVRRNIIAQTTTAWNNYQTVLAARYSLQQAVRSAQLAYKSIQREYIVGSKTFIDSMDAQHTLLASEVELVKSQVNEIIAEFQLLKTYGLLNDSFIHKLSQYTIRPINSWSNILAVANQKNKTFRIIAHHIYRHKRISKMFMYHNTYE